MDSLITLLIFAGAALLSLLFKRKQAAGEETENWPEPRRPGRAPEQPPERRMSWEEELRRLLEGESPKPSPPPPPIIVQQPRRPAAPSPAPTPKIPAPSAPLHAWVERPPRKPAPVDTLRSSRSAYERASRVEDKARAQLKHASDQLRTHAKTAHVRPVPRGVGDALALFRSPQTARVALVASVIFGPPKGME